MPTLTTFDYCLAFGPLAIYMVLLGLVNLGRQPLVVSGARELAALGVALVGFLMIGPMQLFVPDAAAARFGAFVWPLLLSFYGLTLTLWMLVTRPRLVIYNIRSAELLPVLSELAVALDPDARWAGDSLELPQMGIQLRLETFPALRNVSLVANSDTQSFGSWRRLERTLRSALRTVEVRPNPRGAALLLTGLLVLVSLAYQAVENPQAIAQGFFQMLHR